MVTWPTPSLTVRAITTLPSTLRNSTFTCGIRSDSSEIVTTMRPGLEDGCEACGGGGVAWAAEQTRMTA
jgi:hypothetical protein